MNKVWPIFLIALPVLVMIGFIPLVANDYILALLYVVIIAAILILKPMRQDLTVLLFGFVIMILFESIFISTGVETFNRNSLFGLMPVWLPILWAYGFVAIKRAIDVLNK